MEITNLRDMEPFQVDKKIQVRICRIWRGRQMHPTVQDDGLQCILVDHQVTIFQTKFSLNKPKQLFYVHFEKRKFTFI